MKDHLAHVAAWLELLLARIEGRPEHQLVGMDFETSIAAKIDPHNETIFRRHRDRPVADVLAWVRVAHAQAVAMIERLSEADFSCPPWEGAPGGWTLWGSIVGDTSEHYREHLTDIW